MGYFKNIKLINYRNFIDSSFAFDDGCNVIIGKNGSGKTNILEAISLFEKGRGFRKDKIINFINFENKKNNFFRINSSFSHKNGDFNVSVFNETNDEKYLKKILINEKNDLDLIKNFESLFSIVFFLPEMERTFNSSPLSRRNFIDRLIFSINKKYNSIINNYKKNIFERQKLLKNNNYDNQWINILENNIVNFGTQIYSLRFNQVNLINEELTKLDFLKNFSKNFYLVFEDVLLGDSNDISNLDKDDYKNKLKSNRESDYFSGGCAIGPHRSNLAGYEKINKFNINQFSTGQQKTVILQIILAHCNYMIKENLKPIILLDEICSHLDLTNRELLLYLSDQINMQIFMTGTEKNLFSFLSKKTKYCNIN